MGALNLIGGNVNETFASECQLAQAGRVAHFGSMLPLKNIEAPINCTPTRQRDERMLYFLLVLGGVIVGVVITIIVFAYIVSGWIRGW